MGKVYDLNVYKMMAVTSDTEADIVLQDLEQEMAERDRLVGIVQNEIALLQNKIKEIDIQHDTKTQAHKNLIANYLTNVDLKETKTQLNYKLPAGKITVHKPREDAVVTDDTALFEQLDETDGLKHCIKTVWKVDWKETKSNVVVSDGKAFFVDGETGEMVEAKGVSVEKKDEGKITIAFSGGEKYAYKTSDQHSNPDAPGWEGQGEDE